MMTITSPRTVSIDEMRLTASATGTPELPILVAPWFCEDDVTGIASSSDGAGHSGYFDVSPGKGKSKLFFKKEQITSTSTLG
jgi:hypothetical protein